MKSPISDADNFIDFDVELRLVLATWNMLNSTAWF